MFTCNNPEMMGDGSLQVRLPSNDITVYVRDEMPGWSLKDLTSDVMDAYALWSQHIAINVTVWNPGSGVQPTQVVTAHDFGDGIGGVQADQELPWGKGTNLKMRIDRPTAKRNKRERIGILAHEIGHLLGANHSSPTDGISQLMDPTLSNILEPQQSDVLLMLNMGYGKAGSPKPAPSKGRYVKLEETDENGGLWVCSGYFKRAG